MDPEPPTFLGVEPEAPPTLSASRSYSSALRSRGGGGGGAPAVVPTFFCSVCFERHPVDEEGVVRLSGCGHLLCKESIEGFLLLRLTERRSTLQCFAVCSQLDPPTPLAAAGGDSSGGGGSSGGGAASGWACSHCTFVNASLEAAVCEVCELPREAPRRQPGASRGATEGRAARLGRLSAPPRPLCPARQPDRKRTCEAPISQADVRSALRGKPALLAKYNKILQLAKAGTVECPTPTCSAVMQGSPEQPSMTCTACRTVFCFSHGLAHAGGTCASFDAAHAEETKRTNDLLQKDGCKPCPRCKSLTYKSEGCNHMTCRIQNCTCEWCWLCGADITGGVSEHFHTLCRQFGSSRAPPVQPHQRPVVSAAPLTAMAELFRQAVCCRARNRERTAEAWQGTWSGMQEHVAFFAWQRWEERLGWVVGAPLYCLLLLPPALVGTALPLAAAACLYAGYLGVALPLGLLLAALGRGCSSRPFMVDWAWCTLNLAQLLWVLVYFVFGLAFVACNADTLLVTLAYSLCRRVGWGQWADDYCWQPMAASVAFLTATCTALGVDPDATPTDVVQ